MSNHTKVQRLSKAHFIVYTALLTALGVLLPMLFHQFAMAGPIFLPMHFPVIIAGLVFGPLCGIVVGVCSPSLSFLLTGMPPFPTVLVMIPELMAYGGLCGWLRHRLKAPVLVALPVAMVGGRVVLGMAVWALIAVVDFHVTPWALVTASIATGLPGIGAQAVLIPLLVRMIGHYDREGVHPLPAKTSPRNRPGCIAAKLFGKLERKKA